jgi:hypothetical protein
MSTACRVLVECAFVLAPALALAQGSAWEFEIHGGGAMVGSPGGGTPSLPAPGDPFTTAAGRPSVRVSSWFYGAGADLLNRVLASLGTSQRIVPLDPVLTAPFAERANGLAFGARVAWHFSSRLGLELGVDRAQAPVTITPVALERIEASRASFDQAFAGLLATGPFEASTVGSETRIEHGQGNQFVVSGALLVSPERRARLVPYAAIGVGVVGGSDFDAPYVNLQGTYSFVAPVQPFAIVERDEVEVRYATEAGLVGVFGGGLKMRLTPRTGVRVDVRAHVGRQTVATLLSALPQPREQPFAVTLATGTTPSLQFSNNEGAGGPTTLSGPFFYDRVSFRAEGPFRQVLVTAGYYWSF